MKATIGILLIVLGLIIPVTNIVMKIQFNQQCAGYLKQAADANTAELALERLNIAIKYVEDNNLTDGYTSVLWRTEADNIGYWYRNLEACQKELKECLDGTQLEKSNVLMKVRESLTDSGKEGTDLTIPNGISRYPNNTGWGIGRTISYIFIILGIGLIIYWFDNEY